MKIDKLILSDFRTNCYIISHNNIALIIDPVSDGEIIAAYLQRNNLSLKAIFLTHGHQDHIGAVDYLADAYKCTIYAHHNDYELYTGSNPSKVLQIPSLKGIKVTSKITYFDDEFVAFDIDGILVDAILTPGHTEGSVTYVLRKYNRIFSGDTLLKGRVGKTDAPTSNAQAMKASMAIYKTFKDECKVNPGHGDATTIGEERANINNY